MDLLSNDSPLCRNSSGNSPLMSVHWNALIQSHHIGNIDGGNGQLTTDDQCMADNLLPGGRKGLGELD